MGYPELSRDIALKQQLDSVKQTLINQFKKYIPEYNDPQVNVENDGSLKTEMLGYQLSATPRVVKMWGSDGTAYLQWEFKVGKDGTQLAVGGFYLDQNGNVYDYGTGAFNGAPSKRLGDVQNQYLLKNILADLHTTFCDSDALTP